MTVKSRNGQALVEFALVVLLLVILTFGIIEFGLIMYDKAVITNASREGARVGIVAQDRSGTKLDDIASDIEKTVNDYAKARLITLGGDPLAALTVSPPLFADRTFGSDLTVTVQYRYTFLVLPGFLLGDSDFLLMEATTVMKLE